MPLPSTSRGTWVLVAVVLLMPIACYAFLAACKAVLEKVLLKGGPPRPHIFYTFDLSPITFEQTALGAKGSPQSRITHTQIVDLDQDRTMDVLVCDAQRGGVLWYRREGETWRETLLNETPLAAPCHTSVVDLNGDRKLDIVVAILGSVWPTDDKVGRVIALINDGQQRFTKHELASNLRRVSDVQVGDLNGDGQLDLAVAEFGYDHGRVLWFENRGQLHFMEHELYAIGGCIHVPLMDVNNDGRLDIVALMSQDEEEVVVFENRGAGQFAPRRTLFSTPNFDFGSSGLFKGDLNRDGRMDLLLTAGDNLEIEYPVPQPWHGCIWLENKGDGTFKSHRLAHVPGVYAASTGDLDGDGSTDVVLACMFNDWRQPNAASLVWLKNDGKQSFTAYQIASQPTHLATVAVGDLNGDGRPDIVAGSLPLMEPFHRVGRVSVWINTKEQP